MNEALRRLARKQQDIEQRVRLTNWGNWCRSGSQPGLGYATWGEILKQFLGEPHNGVTVDEIDAKILENVISTLDMAGRNGFNRGELWAFCLRVEYVERGPHNERPQAEKAKDVARKFKRPCAERTYRHHLYNARKAVFSLID